MDFDVHPVYRVLRVAQLDVEDLENSVEDTAMTQYKKVLESLNVSDTSQFDDEARLFFRILFWRHSIRKNGASLGQRLMGVLYENMKIGPQSLRTAHFVLTIILPYIRSRLQNLVTVVWGDHAGEFLERVLLSKLDLSLDLVDIVNFLRFLNGGEYRTLTERSLRLHVVKRTAPSLSSGGDFTTMNRELLWHGFFDVLTLLLPIVQYRRYWRRFRRMLTAKRLDKVAKRLEQANGKTETTEKSSKGLATTSFPLKKHHHVTTTAHKKDKQHHAEKVTADKTGKSQKISSEKHEIHRKFTEKFDDKVEEGKKLEEKPEKVIKDEKTKRSGSGSPEKSDKKSGESEGVEDAEAKKNTEFLKKAFRCVCCDDYPVIPCHIGCRHLFCYYCIVAHVEDDENFSCPECNFSAKDRKIQLFRVVEVADLSM